MSITTVIDRLASIQRNIAGVTNADGLSEIPGALQSVMCPAFISVPGEGIYEKFGSDQVRSTRIYIMELYITPSKNPIDFAAKMSLAEVFPARIATAFNARRTLESLGGIEDAQYLRDGGVTRLSYLGGDAEFVAVQCFIEVKEIESVTHVDY